MADKYDWTQLDAWNWKQLLSEFPQFAKYKEEATRKRHELEASNEKNKARKSDAADKSRKNDGLPNYVNASDIFGDNDDGNEGDSGDFDMFFSDEEGDQEERSSDTFGGETIINLNFGNK